METTREMGNATQVAEAGLAGSGVKEERARFEKIESPFPSPSVRPREEEEEGGIEVPLV